MDQQSEQQVEQQSDQKVNAETKDVKEEQETPSPYTDPKDDKTVHLKLQIDSPAENSQERPQDSVQKNQENNQGSNNLSPWKGRLSVDENASKFLDSNNDTLNNSRNSDINMYYKQQKRAKKPFSSRSRSRQKSPAPQIAINSFNARKCNFETIVQTRGNKLSIQKFDILEEMKNGKSQLATLESKQNNDLMPPKDDMFSPRESNRKVFVSQQKKDQLQRIKNKMRIEEDRAKINRTNNHHNHNTIINVNKQIVNDSQVSMNLNTVEDDNKSLQLSQTVTSQKYNGQRQHASRGVSQRYGSLAQMSNQQLRVMLAEQNPMEDIQRKLDAITNKDRLQRQSQKYQPNHRQHTQVTLPEIKGLRQESSNSQILVKSPFGTERLKSYDREQRSYRNALRSKRTSSNANHIMQLDSKLSPVLNQGYGSIKLVGQYLSNQPNKHKMTKSSMIQLSNLITSYQPQSYNPQSQI